MRIGLDFDNTIADYDRAFPLVARAIGLETTANSKKTLHDELAAQLGGERSWQEIQGLVYGRFIEEARPHPGVHEFIGRARSRGHEVFVVSHKTEFGHFDPSRTRLREAAMKWLRGHSLVGESAISIPPSHVHFSETRSGKLSKIQSLDLDVFVDDLLEVLTEPEFPETTTRIWFSVVDGKNEENRRQVTERGGLKQMSSWRVIADEILGELTSEEVAMIAASQWPEFHVSDVERIVGRGNSQIFKVRNDRSVSALKVYPDQLQDPRPRRATEWQALNLLAARGLPVPTPLTTSERLNWSLISWISGCTPTPDDTQALDQSLAFIEALRRISRERPEGYSLASEACLAPVEIASQIDRRIERLESMEHSELSVFLRDEISNERDRRISSAQDLLGAAWQTPIAEQLRVLSPSDFGFHNAFRAPDGRVVFYDLEYFGWDDPVKLVADFALHPGSQLDLITQQCWIDSACQLFIDDDGFTTRLAACLPLYSLRWSLILLNEFRPELAQKRMLAQGTLEADLPRIRGEQLEKARQMIRRPLPIVSGAEA
ncbi:MAG: hypothetical protein RL072_1344 [Actinomycetota bacterium]